MTLTKPDFTEEKLAAISNFSARIVHDLNNLSTIILNVGDIIKKDLENNPEGLAKIKMLEEAGAKLLEYTAELKSFCLKKENKIQSCPVNQIIEDLAATIEHPIIHILCDPARPVARISPDRLRFILAGLVNNAIEASPQRPTIYVESKLNNGVVLIQVRDQGRGMNEEQQRRLCEPYFSSKANIKGAGTSLAKIYYWVHNVGGTINFNSVEGAGTVVSIILAVADVLGPAFEVVPTEDPQPKKIGKDLLAPNSNKILQRNINKLK